MTSSYLSLVLFVLLLSVQRATPSPSPSMLSSPSASTLSPSSANSTFEDPGREARLALINSGPALSYTGVALATIALSAGVDIGPFLKHGQFIALSSNLKGLDVNFTDCRIGKVKSEAQAAQAKCPRNQGEKVFTRWSSFFSIYALNFLIIPSNLETPKDYPLGIEASGYADPFHPNVRNSRAWSTLLFFLILQLIVLTVQIAAYKISAGEEDEYDKAMEAEYAGNRSKDVKRDALQNWGPIRCGCLNNSWPQNLHPCVPIRYWLNMPYLQIKLLLSFHFSICSMALLALVSNGFAAGVLLLLIALAVPVMSFVITMKLTAGENGSLVMLHKDQMYVGRKAWRDRDLKGRATSVFPKSWRKSDYTNKFSAPFYHLKQKRKHYTTIRLLLNFVEASVLVGVFTSGRPSYDGFDNSRADYTSIIAALYYIVDFFFLLLYRPYRRCIKTLMALLQDFMGFVVVMATALYVTEGIFNTQDILKIETNGVELMLCIFCSVGCTVWFVVLAGETALVYSSVKGSMESEEIWDKESDRYYRSNKNRGESTKSALSAMTDRSTRALPAMLLHMKKTQVNGNDKTADSKSTPNDVEMPQVANPSAEATVDSALSAATSSGSADKETSDGTDADSSYIMPEGWQEVQDPASGRSYFYHPTKGTQWTRPEPDTEAPNEAPASLSSDWREVQTPDGRTYFHHRVTNETTWVLPS